MSSLNITSNSNSSRPHFVVPNVVVEDDDDDDDDDDVAVVTEYRNDSAAVTSNARGSTPIIKTTTTALTTIPTPSHEPSSTPSGTNKFKFWFLSDDDGTGDNNSNNNSNEAPPHSTSMALTVLPSSSSPPKKSTLLVSKTLVHDTLHQQRHLFHQQLHEIERRAAKCQADLAQEIMDFDHDIQQCQDSKLVYNQKSIQQMDLYSFLKQDHHHSSPSNNNNNGTKGETDAAAAATLQSMSGGGGVAATTTGSSASGGGNTTSQNWMMYEQRISSLDAQMTHAVHVQLSDLIQSQIHQHLHDLLYTKLPQLLQNETQHYYSQPEQSLRTQWEQIVGAMARHYAEERATRIVAYQTILEQIHTRRQQFQQEIRSFPTCNNNSTLIDLNHLSLLEEEEEPPRSRDLVTAAPTTIHEWYMTIQRQLQQLQQEISHDEPQLRHEHDEQLRTLLLHRTELLQQAIIETFE